ncbi:hypothetical protein [Nostoc sp.]|uniref:hypothetical protein n=1 Tax=Nostoc sp. TaxID=1180 RepID=UPI002FFD32D4
MAGINAIELLREQQLDFIQRIKYSCLLDCQIPGKNSEITFISEKSKIKQISKFSYSMCNKYQSKDREEKYFNYRNNFIGKLGEEAVKNRLTNFITGVDYTIKNEGDGKVDFTFAFDSSPGGIQVKTRKVDFTFAFDSSPGGIQVKTRKGTYDTVKWSITEKEIEANTFLVCMFIEKNVKNKEAENKQTENKEAEYKNTSAGFKITSAGFLPMDLIKKEHKIELIKNNGKIEFTIYDLLYISGLNAYLKKLYDLQVEKLLEI